MIQTKLTRGQIVQGEVLELQADGGVVVNFAGDLVRVVNQTGRRLTVGETLALEVIQVSPPRFRLVGPNPLPGLDTVV